MTQQTKCDNCGNEALIKGTLEGVSFVPEASKRKVMAKGVYGVHALVCPKCGHLSCLQVDPGVLNKILSKEQTNRTG